MYKLNLGMKKKKNNERDILSETFRKASKVIFGTVKFSIASFYFFNQFSGKTKNEQLWLRRRRHLAGACGT